LLVANDTSRGRATICLVAIRAFSGAVRDVKQEVNSSCSFNRVGQLCRIDRGRAGGRPERGRGDPESIGSLILSPCTVRPDRSGRICQERRLAHILCFLLATRAGRLALGVMAIAGCDRPANQTPVVTEAARPSSEVAITTFCGSCHAFPPPSSFPRSRWRHEVEQGFRIYADSGRTDLVRPDLEATVAWFESYAPDDYEFHQQDSSNREVADDRFERIDLRQQSADIFSKTSHILALGSGEFLLSEIYTGNVSQATFHGDEFHKNAITKVADPVHVEPSDLDGDGNRDYVVADIGLMNPSNQRYGTLWWVHRPAGGGEQSGGIMLNGWETVPLKTGYSRVCDARPIDYDQDGDQDLVVAEFGFILEGSVQLLTNVGLENGIPRFESKVVDERNGSIHVPVVDLNGDGLPDFLTLISQQHETIEVHMNLGGGQFDRKVIYAAGDPAYASSGIEVVDLDGDGDLDVLYTNGDTFDDHLAKPFHSVQWLENEGAFPFTHHHLTSMPGVYRAVSGDIDLDGDLDIAAVALISRPDSMKEGAASETHGEGWENEFDGVIWLEQTAQGKFIRHRLMAGKCVWASCELIDLDQDRDLDLVLGRFIQDDDSTEGILLYRNQTIE